MTTPIPSPNYRTGKICYIEIPAIDIAESAQFYQQVFGWQIRRRSDGSIAFDDTVGEVSGTWVLGRPPLTDPGLLVFIMVADAATTIEAIIAAGGTIVQPVNPDEQEVYAHFRDPAGNVLGIYQQAGLAEIEAQLEARQPIRERKLCQKNSSYRSSHKPTKTSWKRQLWQHSAGCLKGETGGDHATLWLTWQDGKSWHVCVFPGL